MQSNEYTYPDGSRYEGEFKDGKRHGRGAWIRPDGTKYIGEWVNDKPCGRGILLLPDGRKYEGGWKEGKRHGQGVEMLPDGQKRFGEWKDGKLIAERQPDPSEPAKEPIAQKPNTAQHKIKPKKTMWWAWAIGSFSVLLLIIMLALGSGNDATVTNDDPKEEATVPKEETVPEPEQEPEPEPEAEEEAVEYVHTFYHLGVEPEEFKNRWNTVIAESGLGYRIEDLIVNTKDLYGFGGDWAVLSIDDWLTLEILIHVDGYVGDIFLDAIPTTDKQGTDLVAIITALIAAVTGHDTERSFNIAQIDLGLEEIKEGFHMELFEGDNAAIRIYGDINGWEIAVEPNRR